MGRQMSRFKRVTLQLGASAAVGCSSQLPTSSLVASESFSVDLYVALSSPAGVLVKKKKKDEKKLGPPAMHQLQPEPRLATAHNHCSHIPFKDTQV